MAERGKVLIYGCYGYTGRLIVAEGMQRGLPMVLSGRDASKVNEMASKYGLPALSFSLDETDQLDTALKQVSVVLHCSGPFIRTYQPMVEACLRNGVHYLDITGEIQVFEAVQKYHAQALEAGVMLLPGVGFDVVPTDCLAAKLAAQMPDAQELHIAIKSVGAGSSRGTTLTMVDQLGEKSLKRRDGKLVQAGMAQDSIMADFGKGPKECVSIPWGDVSTAFWSTHIPNITTYVSIPTSQARWLRLGAGMGWLIGAEWVKNLFRARIKRTMDGPTPEERRSSISLAWAKVRGQGGETRSDMVTLPNGYDFTAMASVYMAGRVLAGGFKPGYQTPSTAFGWTLTQDILAASQV